MAEESQAGSAQRPGSGMRVRFVTAGLLAVALVGLWQAWGLERWAIDGPGAGLWPTMVAVACVALAVVVLVWPGRQGATEDGDTDEAGPARRPRNRSTFALYAVALGVLAVGAAFVGFTLTALAIAIIIVRFAEGRSWLSAITYGLAAAIIGLVCFAGLLRIDLPSGPIERAVLSVLR